MSKRIQIVCIHEGKKGVSIDPVFANSFLKAYVPEWIRPWTTGVVRFVSYGGKSELRDAFPHELKHCVTSGGNTTLIVLADIDDLENGDQLKQKYWETAQTAGISKETFDKVVFIFSKDRIENWIEFLTTGATDENKEGLRVRDNAIVRDAARTLAKKCRSGQTSEPFPPSLEWSCRNWRTLVKRIQ
ncbi:MAG: hypothetical protein LBD93_09930 [Treponema sp.]|jgi:hypothetical protein|nr:hypothetical protein [Treponema sp.]